MKFVPCFQPKVRRCDACYLAHGQQQRFKTWPKQL